MSACGYTSRARGERALSQTPPAGEAAERGAIVTVWLSAPDDSLGRRMPDLTGLAVREALRRLTLLEVVPQLHGHGVVTRQWPPPGATLARGARCDLWSQNDVTAAAANPPAVVVAATAAAGADRGP